MVHENEPDASVKPDRKPHTVEADVDVSAIVEAESHDEAVDAFWKGTNHHEVFTVGVGNGLDATFTVDPDTLQTADDVPTGHRGVDIEGSAVAHVYAMNAEEAREIFEQAINNRFCFDIELLGGLDVTVEIDSDTLHAKAK